jgi:hypothetical protein
MTGILSVDVGGVIIDRGNDYSEDTSLFGDNYLEAKPVDGAIESLAALAKRFQVRIVSKCGDRIRRRTAEWLDARNFWGVTSIDRTSLHFCYKRPEKAAICRDLKVTHFVDDRLEILGYLDPAIKKYLFRGSPGEIDRHRASLAWVWRVEGWKELAELLSA